MSHSTFPNETFSPELLACIRQGLVEDIGAGDVTTDSIVPADAGMKGQIIAKQAGIVAGLDVARAVYQVLNERVSFEACVAEGTPVENRTLLARVSGPARALLTAERTALNRC